MHTCIHHTYIHTYIHAYIKHTSTNLFWMLSPQGGSGVVYEVHYTAQHSQSAISQRINDLSNRLTELSKTIGSTSITCIGVFICSSGFFFALHNFSHLFQRKAAHPPQCGTKSPVRQGACFLSGNSFIHVSATDRKVPLRS
jgi:hypothetical protein